MNTETIRKNKWLIVLITAVSLMFGVNHVINISAIGYELYNPFPVQNGLTFNTDENLFAPAFQDAARGHSISNSQLKEYKNLPSHLDLFPFAAMGFAASLFSAGAREIYIAADFIFPPLAFLLFYVFGRRVFGLEKKLAMVTALFIMLFSFTDFMRSLAGFSFLDIVNAKDYPAYSKLYAPEFTVIPFLASLILLYEAFTKDDLRYSLAASLAGALLFYTYIYYSSFFWATAAILSLLAIRPVTGKSIRRIAAIFIPAAVLAVPYALNLLAVSGTPAYHDLLLRAGLETGRFIPLPIVYSIIALFFLVAMRFVMSGRLFAFTASMLLGAILLMNVQLVTGYSMQPWHWGLRIVEFLGFIFSAYFIQNWKAGKGIPGYAGSAFSFLRSGGVITAVIILYFVFGFTGMVSATNATSDIYALTPGEAGLYKWLDANTTYGTTVMTLSLKESLQIPSFTHSNVYLPDGLTNERTTEELVDRFAYAHAFYGAAGALEEKLNVSNDAFRLEYLNKLYEGKRFGLGDFEKYYFINYFFHAQFFYGRHDFQQKNPDMPGAIGFYFPASFRASVMGKLQNQSYKIHDFDYVLVGPYEKSAGNFSASGYMKVYSNSEFDLYKTV